MEFNGKADGKNIIYTELTQGTIISDFVSDKAIGIIAPQFSEGKIEVAADTGWAAALMDAFMNEEIVSFNIDGYFSECRIIHAEYYSSNNEKSSVTFLLRGSPLRKRA